MHVFFKKTGTEVPALFPATEPANPETHLLFGEIINVLWMNPV